MPYPVNVLPGSCLLCKAEQIPVRFVLFHLLCAEIKCISEVPAFRFATPLPPRKHAVTDLIDVVLTKKKEHI